MSNINLRRYVELEADCKVGFSDSLELRVGKRRYVAHNIITNQALSALCSVYVDYMIQTLGLIRKPNAGWAPAATDLIGDYVGGRWSDNYGDEPPGQPIMVDMQNSWLESWTTQRWQPDSIVSAVDNSWTELTREFLFGVSNPGWTIDSVTVGRYGLPVGLGGSNEGLPWNPFAALGDPNGACYGSDKLLNGIVLCRAASLETPPFDYARNYQPADFHQMSYLWCIAQFKDAGGVPIYVNLDPELGSEQLRLIYKLRLYIPQEPVERVVGGRTLITRPVGRMDAWPIGTFPNLSINVTCQETSVVPDFDLYTYQQGASNQSGALVGIGDYYRDMQYVWEPAYANFPTGVGRVLHGNWSGSQAWCTSAADKLPKDDLRKLIFQARYSWARVEA